MDTRSIFRDRLQGEWSDGLLYAPPVIGFRSAVRGGLVGKSARRYPEYGSDFLLRGERGRKARFQENLLAFNLQTTVPQTDTGGQLEKSKTNK